MNSFRQHFLSKVLAFFAGLAFMNMSFFLAEVSYLEMEKSDLIENIVTLIANTGFEEERDGESSHENNLKGIDILGHPVHIHDTSSYLISRQTTYILINNYLHANYALIFSPPPDSEFLS